jgi:hypothetical protein
MLMHTDQYAVIIYVFFWIIRINGCVRRGRQPLLRGPEWFFNVHVRPDFYTGAGRELLHRYWLRMLIPFAVDIPIAISIFHSGRLDLLNFLVIALCAIIHINHSYSVDLAERQARPFAAADGEEPVASVVLSLTPRRVRDYSNQTFEWILTLSTAAAFLWLARYYVAAPEHHNLRLVFGLPVVFLYIQLGIYWVKRVIVAWRTPVPHAQAAEHLEAREETRKHYLRMCDLYRLTASASILFWAVELSLSPAKLDGVFRIWFWGWMVFTIVGTIWVEIRRKQLVNLALRARPVKLPDFLGESEIARWPLCYQPSAPMLMLRGARGYSLNLANTLAYLGAAYMVGLGAVFALLRLSR